MLVEEVGELIWGIKGSGVEEAGRPGKGWGGVAERVVNGEERGARNWWHFGIRKLDQEETEG